MSFRLASVVLVVTLAIAGCSGTGKLKYNSAEEAFNKGKSAFDRKKYERAVEFFQGVFDYGRNNEWADDAQLYLARTYFANGEYILAANEYSRFSEIYRADERRAAAEYERALSYYKLSPPYQLDQTDTERAITQFQLFQQRFPDSPLVDEAQKRIVELREKMARKRYETARLYERRELFEAAAVTYESVFDDYFDTGWADDALVGALRNYIAFSRISIETRQAERLTKAIDAYRRLTQVFPDSPMVQEAKGHYEEASELMERVNARTPALPTGVAADTTGT